MQYAEMRQSDTVLMNDINDYINDILEMTPLLSAKLTS